MVKIVVEKKKTHLEGEIQMAEEKKTNNMPNLANKEKCKLSRKELLPPLD